MSYQVNAYGLSKIRLNETDTVASVLQNVAIILRTWQNSIPMHRGLGLSGQFVDKPIPAAKPLLVAEITDAISEYEPRAVVVGVTFAIDENIPGKLIPTVEVEINNE